MKWFKELVPYFVILIVVVLIRSFVVTPIKVHGQSMYKTLDGNEIMILNKLKDVERYHIVVANLIVDGKKQDTLIKRVYGLPGETIKCESGRIYINNHIIEDEFGYGVTDDFEEIILGEDEYFLLGDNRENSLDSHVFGPIKKQDIEGVTSFVLYPFSKFGNVK